MKKKIVSLVGALVLTCAMSLNVFAAGSVTAEDLADATGTVAVAGVPTTGEALEKSADALAAATADDVKATPITDSKQVLTLVKDVATLVGDTDQTVDVVFMADLKADTDTVAVKMAVSSTETVWAIHIKADGTVERIQGTVSGDTVTFKFSSYSPVAIVKVAQKAGSSAPAASTTTSTTTTVDGTTVPAAPKTGDVAMMVTVMAVIFMAGAAVAVVMSKKRA
ncbi:MAG: hypothetical protein K2O34_03810 [Acetatifactor sp.]|nr:hypothetical protein [Acetatifactor sp.]